MRHGIDSGLHGRHDASERACAWEVGIDLRHPHFALAGCPTGVYLRRGQGSDENENGETKRKENERM